MAKVGPLFVKVVAAPSGPCLALVTEDGQFFGSQQSVTVHNEVDSIATITVRFYIDGETIRFASK
jgi:hypothetical protein